MNHIDQIKETTLLKHLPDEDIKSSLFSGKFKVIKYKKNSIVHFDGEHCNKLEVILSGKVAVERISESGDLLTISMFYSDNILGGNLLFSSNAYYPMTISTRSPSVILEIDKETLFDLLCKHKKFLRTYLELVADHVYMLGDKIKHYVNKTIRESIINYLTYECKMQKSRQIKLNITKKELAEKIGVQRTSLSRELSKMRDEGLIVYDAKTITILNL
ncbi:Crp/Fnr family transcriptional regulator [Mobilitalea sibirica]|uniref:Crp/Fnr family transcriptional regulator n=1 Tax=Mobilitalea sibirica TaxID=1462919 RepID=A0A8J7HEG2_9FIRM|nr:Crp/Fnr family transcriptional regulator [Mobilitalea sibirica]MBH1942184.1 Crp/Fnr family transcriptional regulator [Mobilitalea sibirica]